MTRALDVWGIVRRLLRGRLRLCGGVAASALLLAGCRQGAEVEVSGTASDLRLAAVGGKREPLCADAVSVTPVAREAAAPVWQVIATDPAKCVTAIRYGQVSDDFAEQVRAVPLRPGIVYRVRISGAGFTAVRDFRLRKMGC